MKNDFHDELREYSRLCSKSLSDDTELCQQVEHELLDHLEEDLSHDHEDYRNCDHRKDDERDHNSVDR